MVLRAGHASMLSGLSFHTLLTKDWLISLVCTSFCETASLKNEIVEKAINFVRSHIVCVMF